MRKRSLALLKLFNYYVYIIWFPVVFLTDSFDDRKEVTESDRNIFIESVSRMDVCWMGGCVGMGL